jgi:thiamine pyrophosphokinase
MTTDQPAPRHVTANSARPRSALVLAGGGPFHRPDVVRSGGPWQVVIAADSGLELASAFGVEVDLVVGDFDSVEPATLAAAEAAGTIIEHHRADKDATDLELAMAAAVRLGAERIVVAGGHGDRLDHLLANVMLLAAPGWAHCIVEAHFGAADLVVVRPGRKVELHGRPGAYVSLLAVGGPVRGVHSEALAYPLRDDTLDVGQSRGVSNEFTAPVARVRIDDGVLVAVIPHARPTEEIP